DRFLNVAPYTKCVPRSDSWGNVLNGLVEVELLGILDTVSFQLGNDLFRSHFGKNNSGSYAGSHALNDLVYKSGKGSKAAGKILEIRERPEWMIGDELGNVDLQSGLLGHGREVRTELRRCCVVFLF